jgi:arylsulfatase A-like enzyme
MSRTVPTPVQTLQIAPTILQALGLNPGSLQSVQIEGTPVLPGF